MSEKPTDAIEFDSYTGVSLSEYFLAKSAEARLRGGEVMIKAAAFNYAGYIVGVIENKAVVLRGAKYVFDTGEFSKPWADAQAVPSGEWLVFIDAMESFGIMR